MRFKTPLLRASQALYRARYVYQLGRKRMGRMRYAVLRSALVQLSVGTAAVVLVAAMVAVPVLRHRAAADGLVIQGGAAIDGRVNQQIAISDISIDGTGDDTVPVKLTVDGGSLWMDETDGLTFDGEDYGSTLQFSGTRSAVNAALATLHYTTTTAGSYTLTISLSEPDQIYFPGNGHVYQYIGDSVTWQEARDAAALATYDGIPGYLATITRSDENDFIKSKLSGDAWLGASDADSYGGEGVWRWVTGPETGTNFYNGLGTGGGSTPEGQYSNWHNGEPNQSGDEDCLETYIANGDWNDWSCSNSTGYVIEYGTDENLPTAIPAKEVSMDIAAATFDDGTGEVNDPYQITDCERLQDMNQDLSASYILTHDIDCTETAGWNNGEGFMPIGYNGGDGPFTGQLDGAGYHIDGLTEIRADEDPSTTFGNDPAHNQLYVGLFGYTSGANIDDVHLTSAMIKGYENVGGIVGYMRNGTLTNSSVNLDITSTEGDCNDHCIWARYGTYGGGLVGYLDGGDISGSSTAGPVKGSGNVIGGLVGYMNNDAELANSTSSSPVDGGNYIGGAVGVAASSTLQNVSASGSVTATVVDETVKLGEYAGGLVGFANGASIAHSRASGDVHADNDAAGGLVGVIEDTTMIDVYATGDVSVGDSEAGGLVGYVNINNSISRAYASGSVQAANDSAGGLIGLFNESGLTVNDSFATGAVTAGAESGAGGIIGTMDGEATFQHVYFDQTGTGQTTCNGSGDIETCTAITTAGYFVHKANAPFTQNGEEVWLGSVWEFDAENLPVFGITTLDDDGISTATENAAPNGGDANDDGTADSEQANVAAFVNSVTGKYAALAVDDGCTLSDVSAQAAALDSDSSYTYPFGLLNFTATCGSNGFTATIHQYFYDPPEGTFVLRKFIGGAYQTITGATVSRQTIGGHTVLAVSYDVTDGGPLDVDGMANGVIVDPAGPAMVPGAPNTGLNQQSVLLPVGLLVAAAGLFVTQRHRAKIARKI